MIPNLKDPVSGLTHFIGALLAVIGLVLLLLRSIDPVKPWHIVSFSIFGAGMIALYSASTLYHWLDLTESGNRRLHKFDHMMIFILIAATYTPICLIPLRGGWGWSLFGVIWGMAGVGILFKYYWFEAPRWLTTGIYIGMGWVVIIGIWPLVTTLQTGALFWLIVGGLFYSFGGVIYAKKKPDPWPGVFGFHEVFHIFVLWGSFAHFWVMYEYVVRFG